ncbi:O-antigen ligase family protein [Halomonas sp. M20]|uniref:O-antigen ligase family protein n=1 Tax=Halomonas sp. M20 TaxID=2763264 RepID=UPI001D0B5F7F|nr:O-antigen ligase family protein [Halomonas sp. M20]
MPTDMHIRLGPKANWQAFLKARSFGTRPAWLLVPGILGLFLYASFRVFWPEAGKLGEQLTAFLGLIAILVYGRGVRNSLALWLLLAAVVVQVLSWWLGYLHHPDWVASNPEVDRLAKLFIFIGVAWWLGGSTGWTFIAWGSALIFYVLATLILGDGIQGWIRGLQGERIGFGIRNLQHGAMLFGVAFLGLVLFARRWLQPGKYRALRLTIWCVLFVICLLGVVTGQTRAIWLALLIALPVAGGLWWLYKPRDASLRTNRRFLAIGCVMALVVLTIAGLSFDDTVEERIGTESQVIAQLLDGRVEELPYTSIGIRIHTWRAASEWIAERPLVGWGGEGRSLVISETAWLPDWVKQQFGHLHNFFLEVWVAYGVLGLAVIGALAFWIGRATWLAWRGGVMPGDMALFGAAFFVYWMIVNQFESYNSFWTGVYVHNLVVGGLVTQYWRWLVVSGQAGPVAGGAVAPRLEG